jgi:hypothetical protein
MLLCFDRSYAPIRFVFRQIRFVSFFDTRLPGSRDRQTELPHQKCAESGKLVLMHRSGAPRIPWTWPCAQCAACGRGPILRQGLLVCWSSRFHMPQARDYHRGPDNSSHSLTLAPLEHQKEHHTRFKHGRNEGIGALLALWSTAQYYHHGYFYIRLLWKVNWAKQRVRAHP